MFSGEAARASRAEPGLGLKLLVRETSLRAIGLDPACAEGAHPERLRKLAREGGRYTAQHLRALSPLRRRATLVATVLDTATRLTDEGVGLFDRAVGRMFRRAEAREEQAVLRDARAVNAKVRLLAKLGTALIEARESDGDLDGAVESSVGWDKLAASIAEAHRLVWPDKADLLALAARAWPVRRRLGPLFLDAFRLRAAPAAPSTLRAVELLHTVVYASGGRTWPKSLPISSLRPTWRDAVLDSAAKGRVEHRRTWGRPCCSRCATDCAEATSGKAAASGARSRTSSSNPRSSPPSRSDPPERTMEPAEACFTGELAIQPANREHCILAERSMPCAPEGR